MEVSELHAWMNDKFETQSCQLKEIKEDLKSLNGQVRSHDRWLWLIRGVGAVMAVMLGFIGIKIKLG